MTPEITRPDASNFPAPCPQCGKIEGLPFMAGTSCEDDRIRVGMRCGECDYEWRIDLPAVRRKNDRRLRSR